MSNLSWNSKCSICLTWAGYNPQSHHEHQAYYLPGGQLRLRVDYYCLNENTVKNTYPLPLMDTLLDKRKGRRYFSALDLASQVTTRSSCRKLHNPKLLTEQRMACING